MTVLLRGLNLIRESRGKVTRCMLFSLHPLRFDLREEETLHLGQLPSSRPPNWLVNPFLFTRNRFLSSCFYYSNFIAFSEYACSCIHRYLIKRVKIYSHALNPFSTNRNLEFQFDREIAYLWNTRANCINTYVCQTRKLRLIDEFRFLRRLIFCRIFFKRYDNY